MPQEITLAAAAHRMRIGYNRCYDMVLKGTIEGRQDAAGRWWVLAASVEKLMQTLEPRAA